MQRLQWNKDHGANLSPQEKELQELKDENRRLKGLLELREDRAALEKFQIQTRNLILGLSSAIVIGVLLVGLVSILYLRAKTEDNREIATQKVEIQKLKNRVIISSSGADDSDSSQTP